MTLQTIASLVQSRPTALGVTIRRGDPIWYRELVGGTRGRAVLVRGLFERYGSLRVAVVLVDAGGIERRAYVSPLNVYPRLETDDHV